MWRTSSNALSRMKQEITAQLYTPADLQAGRPLMLRTGAIIPLDKPLGWTSFDVVNKVRIMVRQVTGIKRIKVGHAGTLDPQATGVLVLCTGRATKLIEQLMDHDKEYCATLRLGATTPSFDSEHEIDATYPYEHITEEMVRSALAQFTGEIAQRPPSFSAIKVGGVRAYDLARQGQEVELAHKRVTIYELELESFTPPMLQLRIVCSRGTYIRSLARDLGKALDSGAYLTQLVRTRSGAVTQESCFSIEQLDELLALTPEEEKIAPPQHPQQKARQG